MAHLRDLKYFDVELVFLVDQFKVCSIFNMFTKKLKNIARIAKRCPENITSVVKCVKLLFTKKLRK